MKYFIRHHDEEEEWENSEDIWENRIIDEMKLENTVKTEENQRKENVESDEQRASRSIEKWYRSGKKIDNTGGQKSYEQKDWCQWKSENRKTERQEEWVIDTKNIDTNNLLEKIEHQNNNSNLQKESEKTVTKSEIQEEF